MPSMQDQPYIASVSTHNKGQKQTMETTSKTVSVSVTSLKGLHDEVFFTLMPMLEKANDGKSYTGVCLVCDAMINVIHEDPSYTAEALMIHMLNEHSDQQLAAFENEIAIPDNKQKITLGDIRAKLGVAASAPVEPEPEPEPAPVVISKVQEPCTCGYQPTSGKDAGVHKRQCDSWKHRNDPKPQPVEQPAQTTEPVSNMDEDQALEDARQFHLMVSDLMGRLSEVEEISKRVRAKREAHIQRQEELDDAAVNIFEDVKSLKTYVRYLIEELERDLKDDRSFFSVEDEARSRATIKDAQQKIRTAEANMLFRRGMRAAEERAMKLTKAQLRNEQEIGVRQQENQAALQKAADAWKAAQILRFERMLDGRSRINFLGKDGRTLIEDCSYEASKAIGQFLKELRIKNDKAVADGRSTVRPDGDTLRELSFEACMRRLARKFDAEHKVTINVSSLKDDAGKLVEYMDQLDMTVSLPVQEWAHKISGICRILANEHRQAEDNKLPSSTVDLLADPRVQQLIGVTILEREDDDNIRSDGSKVHATTVSQEPEETLFEARYQKALQRQEDQARKNAMKARKSDNENPNAGQQNGKNKGKKGRR